MLLYILSVNFDSIFEVILFWGDKLTLILFEGEFWDCSTTLDEYADFGIGDIFLFEELFIFTFEIGIIFNGFLTLLIVDCFTILSFDFLVSGFFKTTSSFFGGDFFIEFTVGKSI